MNLRAGQLIGTKTHSPLMIFEFYVHICLLWTGLHKQIISNKCFEKYLIISRIIQLNLKVGMRIYSRFEFVTPILITKSFDIVDRTLIIKLDPNRLVGDNLTNSGMQRSHYKK